MIKRQFIVSLVAEPHQQLTAKELWSALASHPELYGGLEFQVIQINELAVIGKGDGDANSIANRKEVLP